MKTEVSCTHLQDLVIHHLFADRFGHIKFRIPYLTRHRLTPIRDAGMVNTMFQQHTVNAECVDGALRFHISTTTGYSPSRTISY